MTSPRVSVIIPTFNSERYLGESLWSIITQDLSDFEVIVVDEAGSTDRTEEIVRHLDDPRIRYVRNAERLGLVRSLNEGVRISRGELIARMDADDVSEPERLRLQVELLDRRPDVGVVGSAIRLIDDESRSLKTRPYPLTPVASRWFMLFSPSVPHPGVMFRRSVFERLDGYSEEAVHCEDYELWARAQEITEVMNLPQPLLRYRIHHQSVSSRQQSAQAEASLNISCRLISETLGRPVDRDTVNGLKHPYHITTKEQMASSARLLNELFDVFSQKNEMAGDDHKAVCEEVAVLSSHLFARSTRIGAGTAFEVLLRALSHGPMLSARLFYNMIFRLREMKRNERPGLAKA